MHPEDLINSINQLIFDWQKIGLVIDSRNHQAYQKASGLVEVSWGNDGYILKDNVFSSLSEYCSLLENRQYSMLLSDGAFFQISYKFRRREIVGHRLCWYPSPINLSDDYLEPAAIIDSIIESMTCGDIDFFRSRSPLRFDFSPEQSHEEHPETHLHIGHEDCRIAVKTALSLKNFMSFIVQNFYQDISSNPKLHIETADWFCGDKLTDSQRLKFHLNIKTEI